MVAKHGSIQNNRQRGSSASNVTSQFRAILPFLLGKCATGRAGGGGAGTVLSSLVISSRFSFPLKLNDTAVDA